MQTTPEFQKAAAEAARKDGEKVEEQPAPKPAAPVATPANLNENKITKLPSGTGTAPNVPTTSP
jgi:hypothetical protein